MTLIWGTWHCLKFYIPLVMSFDHRKVLFSKRRAACELLSSITTKPFAQYTPERFVQCVYQFKIGPQYLQLVNKPIFASCFRIKNRWPNIIRKFFLFSDLQNFSEYRNHKLLKSRKLNNMLSSNYLCSLIISNLFDVGISNKGRMYKENYLWIT